MKKIIISFSLSVFLLFFISCMPQKEIIQTIPTQKLRPSVIPIVSLDSSIYLCAQYTLSYRKKTSSRHYEEKEVCSCHKTLISLLEWEITATYSVRNFYGENTLIVWDKDFVINYILPLFKKEEDRKRIEYTLVHCNESTFKNIIDYDNKVTVNDKMYYYPLTRTSRNQIGNRPVYI
jgi:hypothetical protein